MKKMTTLSGLIFLLSLASTVQAAQYEAKDLMGRLMVMDQAEGSVQGIVEIRKAQKEDHVMGSTFVKVNLQNFKGQQVDMKCAGDFEAKEQQFVAVCSAKKVLVIKLNNSNEELVSYLKGSFASAEFTLVDRPLKDSSETTTVDIKNLDMKMK